MEMNSTLQAPKAVYIHIPFCKHKCYYCDFNTYALKGQPVTEYLEALEREMEQTVKAFPPGTIDTIFVGGGTPTVLVPEQMETFLNMVNEYFPKRNQQLEFTMEANPGTTNEEKLQVMKAGGVNRVSFGVQSFNNELLSSIGRIHQSDDVYRSIENARKSGFDNLSIDLMFGLPNQTLKNMEDSLNEALKLDLKHYSIYGLKVEENTLFHSLFLKNKLPLPDEDDELQMFLLIMNRLKEAGYEHYEISNFAKQGYESKHNSLYWHNQSYYGLGAGAHGYMQGIRHVNIKGVQDYIEAAQVKLPLLEQEKVSRQEAMEDFMMVGLRLRKGVRQQDFQAQFDCRIEEVFDPMLKRMLAKKLVEISDEGYRLSDQGVLYGNEVFAEFIS
jgi:putative oxygen-independent coproporphyrinogen III oxidase